MSNKKQTAVEWLHIELQKRFPNETTKMYNNNQLGYEDLIDKAKEMDKQQKIEAVNYGCSDWGSYKDAEQYYKETYEDNH
jgi:hypothetical protein